MCINLETGDRWKNVLLAVQIIFKRNYNKLFDFTGYCCNIYKLLHSTLISLTFNLTLKLLYYFLSIHSPCGICQKNVMIIIWKYKTPIKNREALFRHTKREALCGRTSCTPLAPALQVPNLTYLVYLIRYTFNIISNWILLRKGIEYKPL